MRVDPPTLRPLQLRIYVRDPIVVGGSRATMTRTKGVGGWAIARSLAAIAALVVAVEGLYDGGPAARRLVPDAGENCGSGNCAYEGNSMADIVFVPRLGRTIRYDPELTGHKMEALDEIIGSRSLDLRSGRAAPPPDNEPNIDVMQGLLGQMEERRGENGERRPPPPPPMYAPRLGRSLGHASKVDRQRQPLGELLRRLRLE